MRRVLALAAALAGVLPPSGAPAAPLDGAQPILCAVTAVMECSGANGCERSSADVAGVPPFVRVDAARRLLATVDGARTSPIGEVQRLDGHLMIQGMQEQRVWGLVIDETTGAMSATVAEAAGAIVLSGACVVP
jgi:hypothetical protein